MKLVALALLTASAPALAGDLTGIPRILDGDTVEIGATRIRLEGIDAPESDQLCLDAAGQRWACGIEARDRLAAHFGNVSWTCSVSGQDRYGRSLALCEAGGQDVERWMVRSGWALAFVRYSYAYTADESYARSQRAGLWAGAFIAPWDWRGRHRTTEVLGAVSVPVNARAILLGSASATESPDPHCTIKGNVNRSGECIYHVEGGRYYAKVKMDISKGKRWFCSMAEAEAAGCRPAAPEARMPGLPLAKCWTRRLFWTGSGREEGR